MTSFAIPAPVAPVPLSPADGPRTIQAVPPELGTRAVTAAPSGGGLRNDPCPPRLPAPLKGLGIPPLNTRQVGDFDKLDDPPPAGLRLADRLTDLDSSPATGLDLRR
jgi:hypothetical protein